MDIFSPIQQLADYITYQLFQIPTESYFAHALNFFLYDVMKIGILLVVINYSMAITRYYFPLERARALLARRRWYGLDYLLAALLGVVTPFCSCSSIPLFIGFLGAGIPLGVTFAFLISSPLVNESSLYLFPAIFGWKTTLLYNMLGIVISMAGGMLIQKLALDRYIQPEFITFTSRKDLEATYEGKKLPWKTLWQHWTKEALTITRTVAPYVVLGVALGAGIHGYVPQDVVTDTLAHRDWWSIPLATLLGVPLYANSISVIPVIEALVGKGVPLGPALAFMTATVTLSIPEALMLKRVLRLPLLLTFFGITIVGILIIGYVFLLL